ncbi:phosphomethylpyrimidine synthase ThiC [Desulfovibrio ferrophilus]|uniref:Phosphomethylpyrimidine synthase n=1 Tax=Desulfovibrio ferrophilus TaxID=241368 RepID=A0A2Z6B0M6_9BACT|nr:phosphomethylpyrimidine synthase ThiC [Desulfovibrio ferrophilus]BBD09052.1 thiamine biosynthesis protein ThiC [Desulfovibrio ferrophilus]
MPTNPILEQLLNEHLPALAKTEALEESVITEAIKNGTMVLLANPAHKNVQPTLIGQPASVKVNANIGTSPFVEEPSREIKKLHLAEAAGAHAVMDLSTGGDLDTIRKEMLAATRLPLGTVPLYGCAQRRVKAGAHAASFTADGLFEEIENQAKQGVDFITVHCGVTRRASQLIDSADRMLGVVSRGGSMTVRYMKETGNENPLYEQYDRLLEISAKHNLTLSLGDGMRPGAGVDAGDTAQWDEVVTLAELTRRAWDAGVQVMIEGPGHVPLHLVQAQIQGIKQLCMGAPLYVLGPLVTDSAPGYDHIAGAIGGALAAWFGADFLCYLTPAEHLTLPDGKDVYAGVMASRIAAQAAENALGRPLAVARDLDISQARADLDWNKMADLALDPPMVRHRREDHKDREECAMCGEFCAVKMLKDF